MARLEVIFASFNSFFVPCRWRILCETRDVVHSAVLHKIERFFAVFTTNCTFIDYYFSPFYTFTVQAKLTACQLHVKHKSGINLPIWLSGRKHYFIKVTRTEFQQFLWQQPLQADSKMMTTRSDEWVFKDFVKMCLIKINFYELNWTSLRNSWLSRPLS